MQVTMTMTVGEVLVGFATLLLAVFAFWTVVVDSVGRKRDRRVHVLDEVEDWVKQVQKATAEELYVPEAWESGEGSDRRRTVLLSRLLHLSIAGFYDRIPGNLMFKKHQFEQMANKYWESYEKYTNKLHDMLEDRPEDVDVSEEEVEFENATNDFHKYLIGIRMMEKA